MENDLLHILWLSLCFLTLFGTAEWMYHKLNIKAELTRKTVHFGTGILTLLFPVFLTSHLSVMFLCGSFALLLMLSLKFNLLPSINAIDRESWGSLWFPLSVYICFIFYSHYAAHPLVNAYILYYAPILTLAICDPVAALVGKRFPRGKFKVGKSSKTIAGSSGFFISSLLLNCCLVYAFEPELFQQNWIWAAICALSLSSTLIEAISGKGIDNLSIPLCVMFNLFLLHEL